jgi:purine-binding chemotaxis protein CheW
MSTCPRDAERPATLHRSRRPQAAPCTAPREVLSFKLGAEEYGIDILKVQEIRGYEQPTRIANAPGTSSRAWSTCAA